VFLIHVFHSRSFTSARSPRIHRTVLGDSIQIRALIDTVGRIPRTRLFSRK
jgi:hypothetical protein